MRNGKLVCVPDDADDELTNLTSDARRRAYQEPDDDDDGEDHDCESGMGKIDAHAATHHETTPPRRHADAVSVSQMMKDHSHRMNELYAARDEELRQMWRRRS